MAPDSAFLSTEEGGILSSSGKCGYGVCSRETKEEMTPPFVPIHRDSERASLTVRRLEMPEPGALSLRSRGGRPTPFLRNGLEKQGLSRIESDL